MIEMAKMIGMTPAVLTRSGRKLRRPPADAMPVRGLSTRWADCMGTLRWACWTSMIPAAATRAITAISRMWKMFCAPSEP